MVWDKCFGCFSYPFWILDKSFCPALTVYIIYLSEVVSHYLFLHKLLLQIHLLSDLPVLDNILLPSLHLVQILVDLLYQELSLLPFYPYHIQIHLHQFLKYHLPVDKLESIYFVILLKIWTNHLLMHPFSWCWHVLVP